MNSVPTVALLVATFAGLSVAAVSVLALKMLVPPDSPASGELFGRGTVYPHNLSRSLRARHLLPSHPPVQGLSLSARVALGSARFGFFLAVLALGCAGFIGVTGAEA